MKVDHPLRGLRSALLQSLPEAPIAEFSNVGNFVFDAQPFLFAARRTLKTGSASVVSTGPLACLTVPPGKVWLMDHASMKIDTTGDLYSFRAGAFFAGGGEPIQSASTGVNNVVAASDELLVGFECRGLVLNAGDFLGPWVWAATLGFTNTVTVWASLIEVDPY